MSRKNPALTPLEDALKLLLEDVKPIRDVEKVALQNALGRVLASNISSPVAVPPADNSAMDGYALRLQDWQNNPQGSFAVSQRIPAGQVGSDLEPGTIARIFTGAEVPPGADAVVMQEKTEVSEAGVKLPDDIEPGQNIRARGQDIEQGAAMLSAGHKLRAQDIGLLASVGIGEIEVYRRLKVAVLSTGDELVEPGEAIAPGQIYNSNRYTLLALLAACGHESVDFGVIADNEDATREALLQASTQADCIISSGGVSVGEEDYVKAQVEALGELRLWKLAIKPGKPLAYGRVQGTSCFGLPGNPGAAYVTYRLAAQPYLSQMQGNQLSKAVLLPATACFDRPKPGTRCEHLRARVKNVDGRMEVEIYKNQSSGVLSSVSWANALAIIPIGATVARGDQVMVMLLEEPFQV